MSLITTQRVAADKREQGKVLRRRMTTAERALWRELRANRLGGWQFRRQQIIDGFIVDFYCHTLALVIEVDGPIHDFQQEADRERDAALAGRGLKILRFTNNEVLHTLPAVLARVRAMSNERVTPPSSGEGPGEG